MLTSQSMMGAMRDQADNDVFNIVGSGAPLSGSASRTDYLPTGFNVCGKGSTYTDISNNGARYTNEGSKTNLYWTPISMYQPGVLGWWSDFRDGQGSAVATTTALVILVGSGIKIFGNGQDSTTGGLDVLIGEGGPVASLISPPAIAGELVALGVGSTDSLPFQPDTHGPLVVDALLAPSATFATHRMGIGFIGSTITDLVSPVTGSGTTLTLVQDDLAIMLVDTGLTDTDNFFCAHNKSDEAASHLTSASGVDTGTQIAASGIYQRLRVEISRTGVMTSFVDKIQVSQIAAALDVDEEVGAVLYNCTISSSTVNLGVKYFGAWGIRPNNA